MSFKNSILIEEAIMIEKILALILSVLGISLGSISFIFNAAHSVFDLCGRIGIGGMLVIFAIFVFIHSARESRRNIEDDWEQILGFDVFTRENRNH